MFNVDEKKGFTAMVIFITSICIVESIDTHLNNVGTDHEKQSIFPIQVISHLHCHSLSLVLK